MANRVLVQVVPDVWVDINSVVLVRPSAWAHDGSPVEVTLSNGKVFEAPMTPEELIEKLAEAVNVPWA